MTSGPTPPEFRSIASLRGAGPRTLTRLEKLGLRSIQDLLLHLPIRYEDRTRITPLGRLHAGMEALVLGRIELAPLRDAARRALCLRIADETGHLHLRFFHYRQEQIRELAHGRRLQCFGIVRHGPYGPEMVHPEYRLLDADEPARRETALTPVYPGTEGIHQQTMRRLIAQALEHLDTLTDWLPHALGDTVPTCGFAEALRRLHAPPRDCGTHPELLETARQRLIYEELLAHHLSLGRFRERVRAHRAPVLRLPEDRAEAFRASLPFSLTAAQRRVVVELAADLAGTRPMMRLVQGDVGSGKTVVAALAALAALSSDHQVAIMAPTELLAEQHERSFRAWLEPMGVRLVFLSGKTRVEHRRRVLDDLSTGKAGVVIGTHALFQEQVSFRRLGLVIIDEQHRFGVHQRLALRNKGVTGETCPHQLILTATPIPRTLAMIGYADLDVSIIDERPPGRTPVRTTVAPTLRRDAIIARITDWVARGRQVYWVCTLIAESELLQAEAAEKTAERLGACLNPARVALVHGRLKSAEKEAIMADFQVGRIDILVATTVIEVGLDVPNASLMIIENAERLGLAQLHQLRGRVGRGPGEAHCVLLYQPPLSGLARERLAILRQSDDGFVIAEMDMKLRGPGELLGTRQTGQAQFRLADLARDGHLIETIRESAAMMKSCHPHHVDPLIERWLGSSLAYVEA